MKLHISSQWSFSSQCLWVLRVIASRQLEVLVFPLSLCLRHVGQILLWDWSTAACGCCNPSLSPHPNFVTFCSVNSLLWPPHHEIVALMSCPGILLTCWFTALRWGSDWECKGRLDSSVFNYSHWGIYIQYIIMVSGYQIWHSYLEGKIALNC